MLGDWIEHSREALPQDPLNTLQEARLRGYRCAGNHKGPMPAQAIHLRSKSLESPLTKEHSFLRRKGELTS
jgi:hypothetical protein